MRDALFAARVDEVDLESARAAGDTPHVGFELHADGWAPPHVADQGVHDVERVMGGARGLRGVLDGTSDERAQPTRQREALGGVRDRVRIAVHEEVLGVRVVAVEARADQLPDHTQALEEADRALGVLEHRVELVVVESDTGGRVAVQLFELGARARDPDAGEGILLVEDTAERGGTFEQADPEARNARQHGGRAQPPDPATDDDDLSCDHVELPAATRHRLRQPAPGSKRRLPGGAMHHERSSMSSDDRRAVSPWAESLEGGSTA